MVAPWELSLPECKHVKVGPKVSTPLQNILECAPLTQNILMSSPPKKKLNLLKNGSRLKCLKISLHLLVGSLSLDAPSTDKFLKEALYRQH
jgi:hypothetical protein